MNLITLSLIFVLALLILGFVLEMLGLYFSLKYSKEENYKLGHFFFNIMCLGEFVKRFSFKLTIVFGLLLIIIISI